MLQSLLRTYGMHLARRALPEPAPEVALPGLREGVEVLRDEHGVPHIFAGSAHDLFFAQGWVHAEARLWQMDLFRRAASGRLAEILGDAPVAWEDAGIRWRGHRVPDLDRYLKILGMRRAAEASLAVAGGEAREALEAYAAGVNRYISDLTARRLPLEMKLLDYDPDPWSPVDSLCLTKVMALELSYAIKHKLALIAIADRLAEDPDRLKELLPPGYPRDAPRMVQGWAGDGAGKRATTILGADGQFRAFVGWAGTHVGSNWCVLG
ncbi:MAG TPA: penicillin acylase family protein, partial [Planctomycetota bacterium]|nr:penicillin acylase family protein [Planctomycetota bacterium]